MVGIGFKSVRSLSRFGKKAAKTAGAAAIGLSGAFAACNAQAGENSIFPLFGESMKRSGTELPFGVAGLFQLNGRDFSVDNVQLSFAGNTLAVDDILAVDVISPTDNRVAGFVADLWVLPFLNLYFVAGDGESESDVNLSVDLGLPLLGPLDFAVPVNVNGFVLGGGAMLAGQTGNVFYTLDFNYISTQSDSIDGSFEFYTLTPRIGVVTELGPNWKANTWLGARYYDAEKTLDGSIALLPFIDPLDFSFELNPLTHWEAVAGTSITFSDHWNGSVEVSSDFGDASSVSLLLGYRL